MAGKFYLFFWRCKGKSFIWFLVYYTKLFPLIFHQEKQVANKQKEIAKNLGRKGVMGNFAGTRQCLVL